MHILAPLSVGGTVAAAAAAAAACAARTESRKKKKFSAVPRPCAKQARKGGGGSVRIGRPPSQTEGNDLRGCDNECMAHWGWMEEKATQPKGPICRKKKTIIEGERGC